MATLLLAPGITEADSDPVVLAAGASATVFLTGAGANAVTIGLISIQVQSAASAWSEAYAMESPGKRTARVDGPITFRIHRRAGGVGAVAVGVDRG